MAGPCCFAPPLWWMLVIVLVGPAAMMSNNISSALSLEGLSDRYPLLVTFAANFDFHFSFPFSGCSFIFFSTAGAPALKWFRLG